MQCSICPPTFGMYAVAAHIQGARVISVPLRASDGFALDEAQVLASCTSAVKLVFLCSPNNPTGNLLARGAVLAIARALAERALVVMDEAYVEFAGAATLVAELGRQPNLAILRTLSKAYGLAGARCGTLFAHPEVIALTAKVMPPYAIAQPTCETVLKLLEPTRLRAVRERIALIGLERERMARELARLSCGRARIRALRTSSWRISRTPRTLGAGPARATPGAQQRRTPRCAASPSAAATE